MLKKTYIKKSNAYRVTFRLVAEANAKTAYLCGEFNDWSKNRHKMRKLKDGCFSTSLTLAPGKTYRFRYWLDGERWENDWHADGYLPNDFGSEDSLVVVPESPQ
jgi:1,4-alpha-glucan branching enzyme